MTAAQVLKYQTKESKLEREAIEALFEQFTKLRETVRDGIDEFSSSNKPRGRRAHYDSSRFYIGKGVTRIMFVNVYIPMKNMNKLADYVAITSPNAYKFIIRGRDLTVYIRDDR